MLGNATAGVAPAPHAAHGDAQRALACSLAGEPAEHFLTELLSHGLGGARGTWDAPAIAERLNDPALCLRAIYSRYAFSRRGKDRKALAELAGAALDAVLASGKPLAEISIDSVWEHYCQGCDAAGRKAAPDLNRGVVLGLAGLAQTVARDKGVSLARHAANAVREHGRIEPIFFGIVELRGVGPKVAATMLRDWVYAYDAEANVVFRDSIYLQPIDRWTRFTAPYLLEDTNAAEFPDWILAGKLGKAARTAGVSGIRVSMGISWLGLEAASSNAPEARFLELLTPGA